MQCGELSALCCPIPSPSVDDLTWRRTQNIPKRSQECALASKTHFIGDGLDLMTFAHEFNRLENSDLSQVLVQGLTCVSAEQALQMFRVAAERASNMPVLEWV